jgi:hypothetical protein
MLRGGYRKGTWFLRVRHSTAERPSPLRVCRELGSNALTGSVPSSLSALTNVDTLCVPPSSQRRLCLRPMWVGSVGLAPSVQHVGGCMSGSMERGLCGSRYSQRGPSGTSCD